MNISKVKEENKMVLAIEGRLDTTTAPEAESVINEALEGITELVFDFEKLEYISSAGLRVIIGTQKKMNKKGKMLIKNVNDVVMEVFELTGLSDVLDIQ